MTHERTRRTTGLVRLAVCAVLVAQARAVTVPVPAPAPVVVAPLDDGSDFQQVYLSKDEALAHVFPDAARVVEVRHLLSGSETQRIEKLLGRRLDEGGFFLYAAWPAEAAPSAEPMAYAVIVMEIGKVRPITHIVEVRACDDDPTVGRVGRVAVMIYRETHGAEVATDRFMRQYVDKSLADPIRVDRDVINIAGSTLSAHAICRGVRKALSTVQAVFLEKDARTRRALLDGGSDVTPTGARHATDAPEPARGATDAPEPTRHAADTPEPARGAVDGSVLVRERRVMGTLATVTVCADGRDPASVDLAAAAEAALDELVRWDGILSDWRDDTPLARLNAAPAGDPFALEPDLLAFLQHADRMVDATDGAFDPTLGALTAAGGLRTSAPARPAAEDLVAALAASGWTQLVVDPSARTARRMHPALVLDPGASGKGFALDHAADVLRARGVTRALLSFRSTLLAVGAPVGEAGWRIPVRHDGSGTDVTLVSLVDGALSVSGGAPAGFDDGAVLRGTVVDGRDGVPLPVDALAWVVASSAADADALSTALLVTGPDLAPYVDAAGHRARGGYVPSGDASVLAWPRVASGPAGASRPSSTSRAPER